MRKISLWFCPIVFCVFIFVSVIAFLVSHGNTYSEREKRYLQAGEDISFSGFFDGTSQNKLESFIEDQFPGRDTYVAINAYSMLLSGRNALRDIYFAEDGYLINAPNASDTAQFETTIERFDSFAKACPVPVSMIMVPTNGWIHQPKLPLSAKPYFDDLCFDIADKMEHISFVDPRQTLVEADAQYPVSYKTDHHLTAWGNYTLYDLWCEKNGLQHEGVHAYEVEKIPKFYGTTWSGSGYWLTEPDTVEIWASDYDVSVTISDGGAQTIKADSLFFRQHLSELDKYPVYLDGNHCQTTIENVQAPDRTLLLIKDSYAHCFGTFLPENYSKIIMLDLRYYRGSVSEFIAQNQVDEVLFFYGVSTLLTDSNSAWLF